MDFDWLNFKLLQNIIRRKMWVNMLNVLYKAIKLPT